MSHSYAAFPREFANVTVFAGPSPPHAGEKYPREIKISVTTKYIVIQVK